MGLAKKIINPFSKKYQQLTEGVALIDRCLLRIFGNPVFCQFWDIANAGQIVVYSEDIWFGATHT